MQTALTNLFGHFRFDDIQAGETYVIAVEHKQYRFETKVITINESLSEIDFVAME